MRVHGGVSERCVEWSRVDEGGIDDGHVGCLRIRGDGVRGENVERRPQSLARVSTALASTGGLGASGPAALLPHPRPSESTAARKVTVRHGNLAPVAPMTCGSNPVIAIHDLNTAAEGLQGRPVERVQTSRRVATQRHLRSAPVWVTY